jgi:serine/threonine protein kinase
LNKIDRYLLKEELGRGGMATVYVAYDPTFEREVAIKVLPGQFTHDPTFRARFEREARTIAALEHPAIVPVYDFGEQDGQPYLVMRLMTGGTLADRLKNNILSPAEADRVMNRIARALDSAHAQRIIHRDLKPANILFDRWNEPYLSDFGIAKLAETTQASLTPDGLGIGTPAYMSPEQVMGEADLDSRSDVYALGVVLFQMLTGDLPYQSDTPLGLAMKQVMDPLPNINERQPDLPIDFQRVIEKAMAKERENRYSSATAMALDVTKASSAGTEETTVLPPPFVEKPSTFNRRLYGILALLLIVTIGIIASTLVILRPGSEASPVLLPSSETPSTTVTTAASATAAGRSTLSVAASSTPIPSRTATSRPSASPEAISSPTLKSSPTAAEMPTPVQTETPTPILLTPITAIVIPALVAPDHGVYSGSTTFQWHSQPGVAYQVTLSYPESGEIFLSQWMVFNSWTYNLPGNLYGGWEWFVTAENGLRSQVWTFVNDPFPGNDNWPDHD